MVSKTFRRRHRLWAFFVRLKGENHEVRFQEGRNQAAAVRLDNADVLAEYLGLELKGEKRKTK
jgi:hypothetical protein